MIAPKVQLPGGSGGGASDLQTAYEGGNTITTDGTNGSVIIDNSVGGQELQIKGSSSQQVFEIYDSVAAAGTIFGYTDGSMDFFPSDSANYGIYIAPSAESAAHIRLEPLSAPPTSLTEGDIFLEGAAVDRLKVYANATTNTVAWLSDVTGMTNPMTTGGDIIYGGASGTPTRLANGTAGKFLQSNGTTLPPSWETPAGGGGAPDYTPSFLLGGM